MGRGRRSVHVPAFAGKRDKATGARTPHDLSSKVFDYNRNRESRIVMAILVVAYRSRDKVNEFTEAVLVQRGASTSVQRP
jgi:hypothetical protein